MCGRRVGRRPSELPVLGVGVEEAKVVDEGMAKAQLAEGAVTARVPAGERQPTGERGLRQSRRSGDRTRVGAGEDGGEYRRSLFAGCGHGMIGSASRRTSCLVASLSLSSSSSLPPPDDSSLDSPYKSPLSRLPSPSSLSLLKIPASLLLLFSRSQTATPTTMRNAQYHQLHLLRRDDAADDSLNCGSGGGSDTFFGLRVASVFIILVGSMSGALFPVLARRTKWLNVPDAVFDFAKYFGSGVIVRLGYFFLEFRDSQLVSSRLPQRSSTS